MRVIFITREGYRLSGARVRCYNFARELKGLGIDAEVFSFAEDLKAKYAEDESQMSCLHKLKLNISAFKELVKKEKEGIFYIQRLNYHTLAPVLASLLKKNRIIFDCDDWNIREDPVYYLGLFPSSKMEYLTRRLASRAKTCIAASRYLEHYLGRFSNRVHYLPTGVDTELFSPLEEDNDGRLTFSWIGTAYHKEMGDNLRFIIDCFCQLAEKHDNIYLELAGEGKFFEEVKKEAAGLRHKSRVIIKGWIHPDSMPQYLSSIDIGLLPLTQYTKFNIAKSPTKLFEYMAMAKPTVSSRVGEAVNIVKDGETGLLAEGREEFAAKMEKLIKEPVLRRSLGENARKETEREFSLRVLGRRLNSILGEM